MEWWKIEDGPMPKCPCGEDAMYGLVPSELGIGWFCGNMVVSDKVSL